MTPLDSSDWTWIAIWGALGALSVWGRSNWMKSQGMRKADATDWLFGVVTGGLSLVVTIGCGQFRFRK